MSKASQALLDTWALSHVMIDTQRKSFMSRISLLHSTSVGQCPSDRVTPDTDDDWLLPHLSNTSVLAPTVTPHIPISSFSRT
ncbi:hypothetical protein F2Q69_00015048 [Brassica cretica]|uniref:Uncharacterized protein n=1 Tax=Brassica cretica TaxID=69181 RepID=A0A8S9R929_BRACR|nr:hypothetical protein F2Q69_00015048 [Brassica cretica]